MPKTTDRACTITMFSNNKIPSAAPKEAPAATPNVSGVANGLLNKP